MSASLMATLQVAPQADASGAASYTLSGELTFASVTALMTQGQAQFAGQSAVLVDLSGVTHSDSAGLSLLIEWLRQAKQQGTTLRYTAMPPQLQALAAISEVSGLLSPTSA